MSWQDVALAAGSVCFTVALIPTVRGPSKPALVTSLVTAVWLAVFAVVYITLSLWLAGVTAAMSAAMWAVLAVQSARSRTGHVTRRA